MTVDQLLDQLARTELTEAERNRMLRIALINRRVLDYEQVPEVHRAVDAAAISAPIAVDLLFDVAQAIRERSQRLTSEARSRMAQGSLSEMLGGVDPATVVAPRCRVFVDGRQCVYDDHGPDVDHRFA